MSASHSVLGASTAMHPTPQADCVACGVDGMIALLCVHEYHGAKSFSNKDFSGEQACTSMLRSMV